MATPRVVQNAIFDAVERIERVVDGFGNQRHFCGGNVAVSLHGARGPEMAAGVVARPVIRRVARDDAVEIARVTLRFDEGLVSALRAAVEICVRSEEHTSELQSRFDL